MWCRGKCEPNTCQWCDMTSVEQQDWRNEQYDADEIWRKSVARSLSNMSSEDVKLFQQRLERR